MARRPRGVAIRPMRAADVPAVARIERAVFGREAWPTIAFTRLVRDFRRAGPARGRLWVATGGGAIVGYLGLELSALGGEADIINLAVAEGARRRGIGRRLLRTAEAYCADRGIPLLWLRMRASNRRAWRFYQRTGFRVVGRFRDYYEEPDEGAVLMAWGRYWRARP